MTKKPDSYLFNRRVKILEERVARVEDAILEVNAILKEFDIMIRKVRD